MGFDLGSAVSGVATGGLLPLINGLGANMNSREGGMSSGNVFTQNADDTGMASNTALQNYARTGMGLMSSNSMANAASNVQSNPLTSGLFGPGGTMQQTEGQVSDLQNQGFQLTPEDRTAYGQVSGDIARQFDQSDQNLSNSLANRGLSSSGVAGQMFANTQGSKNEQLAQSQMQIANQRMQTTMQRLGQAQSFLSQLGTQAQNAQGQQFNAQETQGKDMYNAGTDYLKNIQGTNNENLSQTIQTQHPNDFITGLTGGIGLGTGVGKMMSGFSGGSSPGGMGGSGAASGPVASSLGVV